MNVRDICEAIIAVFVAGTIYNRMNNAISKNSKDANALGDKVRQLELKLHYVAMMATPEEKRQEVLNALVRRLT